MESINILVAGDFCVRYKGEEWVSRAKEIMGELRERIAQADLSVVNVETVFTDTPQPIVKSGPPLSSSTASLALLKELNFDIAAYANNHTVDQGIETMFASINHLKNAGMKVMGAGENKESASSPLYVEVKGKQIAFFNFCEHEFGIAGREQAGTAGIDVYENSMLIKKAKERADFVIVYLHAGCEEFPLPRPGLVKLCRAYAEAGASAVITAHSHCPVGCEVYKNVPICYGLGNLYFPTNNLKGFWNTGYMAELIFSDHRVELRPVPYTFGKDGEYLRLLNTDEHTSFMKYLDKISGIIHDTTLYENLWSAWCYLYVNSWVKNFLKNFDIEKPGNDQHTLFIRNSYTCESHAEVFKTYYTDYCNNEQIEDTYIDMLRKLQKNIVLTPDKLYHGGHKNQ